MQSRHLLLFFFIAVAMQLKSQSTSLERQIDSEFKMTFPSIYFKTNSTDYAPMPYSVDSCLKHMAANAKDINSYALWRDSSETEILSKQRIKKLELALRQYRPKEKIRIQSMDSLQKISRFTINTSTSQEQRAYLLSLNSVLDISKVRFTKETSQKTSHIYHPKIWCWDCWKSGFHMDKSSRDIRKIARHNKQKQKNPDKKSHERKRLPRLVWTGWKTGFHWSTPGKTKKKS